MDETKRLECAFCDGDRPVVGTSSYDEGGEGPACADCCDPPNRKDCESVLAYAEQFADWLSAKSFLSEAGAVTGVIAAIAEVRRLRAELEHVTQQRDDAEAQLRSAIEHAQGCPVCRHAIDALNAQPGGRSTGS